MPVGAFAALVVVVWWELAPQPATFTGAVKVTISRLRAKLGEPTVIEAVAKAGYRI